MDLVRTTGTIDELLGRATEKALSRRLLKDYQNAGELVAEVDTVMPTALCALALEGLLSGELMRDPQGHTPEDAVTDSADEGYWEARINEAKEWWVVEKDMMMILDSRSLSELQAELQLPSKNAARRWAQRISEELLFRTVLVESIDEAIELVQTGWEPEESCLGLRSNVVDWVVDRFDLPQGVATKAKEGDLCLGIRPSEHYSPLKGLYTPSDNSIRVRCELRHPHPLAAIIVRRATIVHEAVHAVTAAQIGPDNLDIAEENPFLEGLAEVCALHYLKDKFEQYEDWLYLPYSEEYEHTSPPEYVEARRRIESIFDLTGGDYRILSALLRMDHGKFSGTDMMDRIERLVGVLGRRLAGELLERLLDSVQTDLVAPVLYVLADRPVADLLDLRTASDETWGALLEATAGA